MNTNLNPNLFWYDFCDNVYHNADENDKAYSFNEYYEACFGKGIEVETVREFNNRNFESLTTNTKTAQEMARCSHNLSRDAKYSRMSDGSLWIWSDIRRAWVQIDK